jgi:uncharacterized membrane protein (UPF0127 family)
MGRLARVAGIAFIAFALLAPPSAEATGTGTLVLKTETGDHSFNIELATTREEQTLGLMFRRSLPDNAGMLFLYDQPKPATMWMKNTLIPLDMVFIAPDGTVLRIERHTEPLSTAVIQSEGAVSAVLELNAGQADKIGLRRGDKVIYPGLAKP